MESGVGGGPDLTLLDGVVEIVPGELEFQQIMTDIDENLKRNAVGVEQCLQELQSEIYELCPSEQVKDTTSCLLWLNNCSLISLKPSSTPHGQLLEFLRTLFSLLKNHQTEDETILDFLQELSDQCGVLFPCTPSGNAFHFTSQSSLHAVDDDSTMDVKSMWDNVRLHLRRFLLDKLQSLQGGSDHQSNVHIKAQCLKHLTFLYPESEVLSKYQSIQKTYVTDILSVHALTALDENHLENLVHGCRRSFSVLYTAIKDDMTLLSGMIEPLLVVKFINETFLEIITEEITALIGRVGILHLKESTLPASKGIKNKHKGAVHAMATLDHSKKGKNVCLSFQQLSCLSQLVKLLLWLEEQVQELPVESLCTLSYPDSEKHSRRRERKTEGSCNKSGGESLAKESKANESNLLPERLLQVTEPAVLSFGWRRALKELSESVTHSLTSEVVDFCSKILEPEQQPPVLSSAMILVSLQHMRESRYTEHGQEWPKQVLKFCYDIMEELHTLLPLALACHGESLQDVRAAFVEVCSKVLTTVLARLELRSKQVPSEAPVQNLYAVLSSAVYIHQHLIHYDSLMKDSAKKPQFVVPAQRYQEFISTLQFQVTNYCVTACATSVLQDAESHNWDDKKAFYEGERCSFSIQMWHYFIGGLRHDLWTILPPRRAQETLAEVLMESLALLASRYAAAQPTYKRAPQIKIDVASILLSVEHFLWSLCSSVRELCNPTADLSSRIFQIHIHCNNLLIALCVTGAPLSILHEEYQNGLGDCDTHSAENIAGWRQWLYSMEPSLALFIQETPSVGEMTLLGHLKLLLSQPHCDQNLLLGALLSQDCLLASIFLSSSPLNLSKYEDQDKTVELCPGTECTLVQAVFSVLSYSTLSPRSLAIALERFMEKEQLWGWLSNFSANTPSSSEPEVICCLRRTLVNSVTELVKQITSVVHSWNGSENFSKYQHMQRVPESLLKTLPKEWNYSPKEMNRNRTAESVTELAARAVSIVIAKLPSIIACLLPSVKYFFFLLEQKLSELFSKSKEAGLVVWSLLLVTSRILEDGAATERLTGATLGRGSLEKLGMVSVCLEGILGTHESRPNQVAQKVIQTIEKQKPMWLQSQVQKSKRLSMEGFHTTHEDVTAVEAGRSALELTEQKINTMVLDICHKPGGGEYLQQIYHIIRLNEEYLNELLSSQSSPFVKLPANRPVTWNTKIFEEQSLVFNPFQAFILPMANLLHEPSATEWEWDWSDLLPRCRALNGATFRTMLTRRLYKDHDTSRLQSLKRPVSSCSCKKAHKLVKRQVRVQYKDTQEQGFYNRLVWQQTRSTQDTTIKSQEGKKDSEQLLGPLCSGSDCDPK